MHLHVHPCPRVCGPHTYESLAATRVCTHTLHAFSCAKLPGLTCRGGTCRRPSRVHALSAHASPHTRVEGHACAHTCFPPHMGKWTCASARPRAHAHTHTHTHCAQLHTNASQPGNVQEPKGKKDANPTGLSVSGWGGAHGSLHLPLVDGHLLLPPQRDVQLRTKTVGHTFRSQGRGWEVGASEK